MKTTITLELDVDVDYEHYKGCKATQTDTGDAPSLEVTSVLYDGIDLTEAITAGQMEYLEEECWEDLYGNI